MKAGEAIGKHYAETVKAEMKAKPASASWARSTPSSRTSGSTASSRPSARAAPRSLPRHGGRQTCRDVALGAAENLMTANPTMNTLYATGEPALIGSVSAVESQGRQSDVRSSAGTSPPRR